MKRIISLIITFPFVFSQSALALSPHSSCLISQSEPYLNKTEISFEVIATGFDLNKESLVIAEKKSPDLDKVAKTKIGQLVQQQAFLKIFWNPESKQWEQEPFRKKERPTFTSRAGEIKVKLNELQKALPNFQDQKKIEIFLLDTQKTLYLAGDPDNLQLTRVDQRKYYIPFKLFLTVPTDVLVETVLKKGGVEEKLKKLAPYIDFHQLNFRLSQQHSEPQQQPAPQKTESISKIENKPAEKKVEVSIIKIKPSDIKPLSRDKLYDYRSGKLTEIPPFSHAIKFGSKTNPKSGTIHSIFAIVPGGDYIGVREGLPTYVASLRALYPNYEANGHSDKEEYEKRLNLVVKVETVNPTNKILKLYALLADDYYVKIGSYGLVQKGEAQKGYLPPLFSPEKLDLRQLIDFVSSPTEEDLSERENRFAKCIYNVIKKKTKASQLKEQIENIGFFPVFISTFNQKKTLSFPTYFPELLSGEGVIINLGKARFLAQEILTQNKEITEQTSLKEKEEKIQAYLDKNLKGSHLSGEVDLSSLSKAVIPKEGEYVALADENFVFHLYPYQKGQMGPVISGIEVKIIEKLESISESYVNLVVEKPVSQPVILETEVPSVVPQEEVVEQKILPINFIRSQSDLNKKALLALVLKIREQKSWFQDSMEDLRKEYSDLFRSIGPIVVSVKKDAKGHSISYLATHQDEGEGLKDIVSGKVRWTKLLQVYPDLVQDETEVLLIPVGDLSFNIALQDQSGIWKSVSGARLGLTNEFKKRFINEEGGPKPKYLDLEVTAKKGDEPFAENSAIDFYSLFADQKSDSKKALQINSSLSELILKRKEKEEQLLQLVEAMVAWLEKNKKADFSQLQAEFRKPFLALGAIWVKAEKGETMKDGPFLSYIPLEYFWSEYNGKLGQRLRWTQLFKQFPQLNSFFQQGEDLLLVPNKDLTFSVVIFDSKEGWKQIQGTKVEISRQLKSRFIEQQGKNRKFLDLNIDSSVQEPFGKQAKVNFSYLNTVVLEKPKEKIETAVFELSESIEAIQKATPQRKAHLLSLVKDLVRSIDADNVKKEKEIAALRAKQEKRFQAIGPILLEVEKDSARKTALISNLFNTQPQEEYWLKGKVRWTPLKQQLNGSLEVGSRLILVPAADLSFDILAQSPTGQWVKVQGANLRVTSEMRKRFIETPQKANKNKKYMEVFTGERFKQPFTPVHIYRFPAEYVETAI